MSTFIGAIQTTALSYLPIILTIHIIVAIYFYKETLSEINNKNKEKVRNNNYEEIIIKIFTLIFCIFILFNFPLNFVPMIFVLLFLSLIPTFRVINFLLKDTFLENNFSVKYLILSAFNIVFIISAYGYTLGFSERIIKSDSELESLSFGGQDHLVSIVRMLDGASIYIKDSQIIYQDGGNSIKFSRNIQMYSDDPISCHWMNICLQDYKFSLGEFFNKIDLAKK